MTYITKCNPITKGQIETAFKDFNYDSLGNNQIKKIRITGKPLFSKTRKSVSGTIVLQKRYMDYDYETEDNFELVLKENPIFLKDELNFTIFPDINIISFDSKSRAKLYGLDILSKILYKEGKRIRLIHFKPEEILTAKKKGLFDNIWFNGVREEGNITYTGQYGEEIDEDNKFIDDAENREGIGVEIYSKTGKRFKVASFKSGSLVKHIHLKSLDEDILLLKEIIEVFLPYSDFDKKMEIQEEITEDYQD